MNDHPTLTPATRPVLIGLLVGLLLHWLLSVFYQPYIDMLWRMVD